MGVWAFYLVWALLLPLALWAVIAPGSYFQTFKSFGFGWWDRHGQRGPLFVRLLGLLVLAIMGVQIYAVTSGAMRF